MKIVDVAPPEPAAESAPEPVPESAAPAKAANGNASNGLSGVASAPQKAAETEVVLVKEGAKKAATAAARPAEPKIFVSPRAPDDPGPLADKKR